MYRACFADGSELRVRHGRDAMAEEIRPRVRRPRGRRRSAAFCDWLDRAVRARDAALHRARTTTRRSTSPRRCARARAPPPRRLPPARAEGRRAPLRRRAAAAPLQLPVDVRRPGPARGARPLRRHHLHGHRERRLRPRGRHARAARWRWPRRRAGGRRRSATATASIASSCRTGTTGAGRAACASPTASCSRPTRSSPTPTSPSPTGPCCPGLAAAARWPAAATTPPRPSCGTSASAASLPPGPSTTTSTSAAPGTAPSGRSSRDGVRMPDPSLLVSVPSLDEPTMAPAGPPRALRARADAEPRRHGRLDGASAGTARDDLLPPPRAARLPDRRRGRGARRPARLGGAGDGAGHAVRAVAPVPPDRARSARGNIERRAPGLVFAGSGTVPGVGVPMVLVSGRLAAERVEADGGADDDDHARARATPAAGSSTGATAPPTTGRPTCCRGQAPPRVGALRASAATPTTSSTTSAHVAVEVRAKALAAFGDRFFADLAAGRLRRPGPEGGRAHRPRAFDIDPDCFDRFLRSMAMDLTGHRYETWDDLLRLHGRLGRGDRRDDAADPRAAHPDALEPARDLGNAFQLTNFLRDVAEDLDRGRVYLPQEDLDRFGADPAAPDGRQPLAGADALRDRPVPAPSTARPTRASRCCRPRRPAASAPPGRSTPRSSTASRPPATTCSPPGHRAHVAQGDRSPPRSMLPPSAERPWLERSSLVLRRRGLAGRRGAAVAACRTRPARLPAAGRGRRRCRWWSRPATRRATLPALLASLRPSDPRPLEVIVVDDGSTDATAEVAARPAATGDRRAAACPTGWLGKPWACHTGPAAASGERLLFLDADTWLAPDALARLVAAHDAPAPDGLLSVQPYHVVERPYEQLSAVCNTRAGAGAVDGRRRGPRHAAPVAFGPCLVTRADALAAAGGFAGGAGRGGRGRSPSPGHTGPPGRRCGASAGGDAVSVPHVPRRGRARSSRAGPRTSPAAPARAGRGRPPAGRRAVGERPGLAGHRSTRRHRPVAGGSAVAWAPSRSSCGGCSAGSGRSTGSTAVLFPLPLLAFVVLFAGRSVAAPCSAGR